MSSLRAYASLSAISLIAAQSPATYAAMDCMAYNKSGVGAITSSDTCKTACEQAEGMDYVRYGSMCECKPSNASSSMGICLVVFLYRSVGYSDETCLKQSRLDFHVSHPAVFPSSTQICYNEALTTFTCVNGRVLATTNHCNHRFCSDCAQTTTLENLTYGVADFNNFRFGGRCYCLELTGQDLNAVVHVRDKHCGMALHTGWSRVLENPCEPAEETGLSKTAAAVGQSDATTCSIAGVGILLMGFFA
jgi:hypothetical protein